MTVEDTSMPAAKPWWQSKIVIGVVVSLASKLLIVTGLTGDISGDDAQKVTDIVVGGIGLVGDAVALVGRVNGKPNVPLTGSKATAEAITAEVNAQAQQVRDEVAALGDVTALSAQLLPLGLVGQAEAFQQERQ